ncbi:M23 family metallopeptidase [Paenibacillus apiarius]|uniref:M23 family metallopeptidase n=1 Tax=Paenibacillus apiarius TaxID=46240 RepID=A0ABT4E2G0_9BACL|nr:M23 family metallopeptidase [Paenibacillus apiarius]MCY9516547.1 M23 family metallopeptidase [Paenibacillus apiarius]MCY9522538.1 M23 family metallopeptidase [Paenibacillus apiarius]MCY9554538.1 M23 family metallopeptidase [Paenibacillus apiarius]MCY9556654.1 M23 family metallopeptidase [Paenibacillus apiarius]MCY9686665.1 M23 family metallopeptidase [Paenibacillus apiarius]
MIEDIRRRRQERIRAIINQNSPRANAMMAMEPQDATDDKHIVASDHAFPPAADSREEGPWNDTVESIAAYSADPERMWKSSRGQWHERYGWDREPNGGLWRSLRIRLVLSVLLTAAVYGLMRYPADWNAPARAWIVQALTEEMDMKPIAAWYNRTFSGAPSFIPRFAQGTDTTKPAQGRISLIPPLKGQMVQPFAMSLKGVHIASDSSLGGEIEVHSATIGRVRDITRHPEKGITVIIQHAEGLETVYGGLASSSVQVNDWVEAGEAIGVLADSSSSAEQPNTLYFSIKKEGQYIDPSDVISFD